MSELKAFKTRARNHVVPMSAEECSERAKDLFAKAYAMKPGGARQSVLKEACDYRMLGEMKRMMALPKRSSPAG